MDISIPRGDSDYYDVIINDTSTGVAIPANIAGYTLATTVKRSFDDADNEAVIPTKTYVLPTIGTGTVSSSGTAITGTGTLFLSQFSIGDTITADGMTKIIDTITDNIHLTTTVAFSPALSADTFTLGTYKYRITWSSTETNVPPSVYVFDVRVKDTLNAVTTFTGSFTITATATRTI